MLTTQDKITAITGSTYASADIESAIEWASAEIEAYCGRTFSRQTYHEWICSPGNTIQLTGYPVLSIPQIKSGRAAAITISGGDTCIAGGTLTIAGSSLTLTDYDTLTELAAALNDLDGITAVIESGYEDVDPMSLMPDTPGDGTYYGPGSNLRAKTISTPAGLVSLWNEISGYYVYIKYDAGYDTIPADLARIATEMAISYLRGGDTSTTPGMKSETLGDYSYTRADNVDNITQAYSSRLSRYRRTVL